MGILAIASARALPLAPGGIVPQPGTTAAARPDLAGVVIRDALIPFEIKNAAGAVLVNGWLQDRVVRSTSTGRLHFYYRVHNTWGAGAVTSVQRHNYAGVATDVDWRIDGLGVVAPANASRSVAGNLVSFPFPGGIWAGGESRFVFIATNRGAYNLAGQTRITANGGAASVVLLTAQPA